MNYSLNNPETDEILGKYTAYLNKIWSKRFHNTKDEAKKALRIALIEHITNKNLNSK